MTDLLPPNASPFERAMARATARISAIEHPIDTLLDPAAIEAKWLPWLAWAFSVDRWNPDWPETRKRAAIAEAIPAHRRKGTPASVDAVLADFDALLELVEWHQVTPRAHPHLPPPDNRRAARHVADRHRPGGYGPYPQAAGEDRDTAIVALDRLYLADKDEAPAFCHACGQPLAQAQAYLLTDAIADYRLEWGDTRASADTIAGRLAHVVAFLDAEEARGADGRFGLATSCAAACSSVFVHAFRAWSKQQPVEWRNGAGEVTVSRQRSPAATEASIAQLIAVLNHAANADPPRSDKRPIYKPLPARQVQRQRRTRIGVEELARMFAYAAEPNRQRGSLHAFLVGSLCTIARPGAVVDISVAPDRQQWWPGAQSIDLNPQGRTQNKKHRALLPILPLLDRWLNAEYATYMALPIKQRAGRGWLVNYHGRPVQDVDRAWDTMLKTLDMPTGREWRPYVLRHSLATLVRNRGAEKWDLEGFMGHRAGSQTEVYAIGEFPTVVRALTGIISEIEALAPGTLHRNSTGNAISAPVAEEEKM